MKRSNPHLLDRVRGIAPEQVFISVVTEAELLYGMRLSARQKVVRAAYEAFIRHVAVLAWDRQAAEHYAEIRAALRESGKMIGANDLMIAAHCRSFGATLITNNEREFRRVKGLSVENWCA